MIIPNTELEKVRPWCLWEEVFFIVVPFIKRGEENTGLCLWEIISDSVVMGLKVASQATVQSEIVCRSVLRSMDWLKGTAHNDIQTCIISKQADRTSNVFDYIIKSGPRIDPCGTPAKIWTQFDGWQVLTTRCPLSVSSSGFWKRSGPPKMEDHSTQPR